MYAAHKSGQTAAGFDVAAEGEVPLLDAAAKNILDLARTKVWLYYLFYFVSAVEPASHYSCLLAFLASPLVPVANGPTNL